MTEEQQCRAGSVEKFGGSKKMLYMVKPIQYCKVKK